MPELRTLGGLRAVDPGEQALLLVASGSAWVVDAGIILVAVSTVFSGGHYLLVWGLRAWRATRP